MINNDNNKKSINYLNGKVYKIQKIGGSDLIYVGSTTKKYLSQRMTKHRGNYKCWQNGTNNKTTSFDIFDMYGLENCEIVLLQNCKCENKDELLKFEKYYIQHNNCVNKQTPGTTRKEQSKKYYDNNKDMIKNKYSIKNICQCGGKHTNGNKAVHEKTIKHINYLKTLK